MKISKLEAFLIGCALLAGLCFAIAARPQKRAPEAAPGRYTLTVEFAPGFKPMTDDERAVFIENATRSTFSDPAIVEIEDLTIKINK